MVWIRFTSCEIMIHYLHREQVIPADIGRVWEYFSNPKNLNEITPADMHFQIVAGGNEKMYEGQIIEYRVEFIRGVRSLWLTEITHAREYVYFVDEQRAGPYRFWHHEHKFQEVDEGIHMTDLVTYEAPFGIWGDLVTMFWIRRKLEAIFDFRRRKISELFGESR